MQQIKNVILLKIVETLDRIVRCICPAKDFAVLLIFGEKGLLMPATIVVGKTATAVLHEFSNGVEFPPPGPVSYTSSDTAVATVDPTSGLVTGVAVGTATITGTDASNALTASDTVTVTAVPVLTATLVITPNP